MQNPLAILSQPEINQLKQAPALITMLIAGADAKIDDKEKNWATKIVRYRTFTSDAILNEYYQLVDEVFETQLQQLESEWGPTAEDELSQRLADMNVVLAKLTDEQASAIKDSWRSLAKKVAEASGGLAGFGSISHEEHKWVNLPMLQ